MPEVNVRVIKERNNGIKSKLSQQYYREGVEALKSDINKSVALFESSLSFEPSKAKVEQ